MNSKDLMNQIHETAKTKGFWEVPDGPLDPNFVLAKLALIHSEVSEILEAYRKQQGSDKIMEEFADVFIRTFDLIAGMAEHGDLRTDNIDEAVAMKAGINQFRAHKHGNLI